MHWKPLTKVVTPIYASVGYEQVRDVAPAWRIDPGSPLGEAGLRLGDRVVSIDGLPVDEYTDLWPVVRDGYGRLLDVEVLRTAEGDRKSAYHQPTRRETLQVRPRLSPDARPCPDHVGCSWIGDLNGLLSTGYRDRTLLEALRVFVRELATVAGMALDPSKSAHTIYKGEEGHLGIWVRWLVFTSAAEPALRILAGVLALAVLGHGALPPIRAKAGFLKARLPSRRRGGPTLTSNAVAA